MEQIFNFATIGAVFEDGVTLIFDGQTEATQKHYKCNTAVSFTAGDRVKILADSGTYVVEYVVGLPKQGGGGSDAATLNGKQESELSVDNAAKLGGKLASKLSVLRAARLANGQSPDDEGYDIRFKWTGSQLYITKGTSDYPNWTKIYG